jgi:oligoendopeptidase F
LIELSRRQTIALTILALAKPDLALAAAEQVPSSWDLIQLFKSDQDWEREAADLAIALPALAELRAGFGADGAAMAKALETISLAVLRVVRLFVFASLKADEDLRIARNVERRDIAQGLLNQHAQATAWVRPAIVEIGATKVTAMIADEPRLSKFRFRLENDIRLADHVLDFAQEALLAAAEPALDGPSQIRQLLLTSDLPWPELALAKGNTRIDLQNFSTARSVANRSERKRVVDAFFGSLATYQATLGAALATKVKANVFKAKARNYPTALAAAMGEPNIPVDLFTTLLREVNNGLPLLYRYFDLRRRIMGLDDLQFHDINTPLTKLDRHYDLATARRLTLEAVQPLGRDYVNVFARRSMEKWVDAYPRLGKREGGYVNGSAYDVHPFVLMNFTGDFFSLSTYAHEWGHAMHFVLAAQSQPYETYPVSTFAAEIPSTTNEQLLLGHLLRTANSKDERLFYLDRICESIRTSLFGQTMYAEFELTIHKVIEDGEALSGERMSAIWLALSRRYHGPGVVIDPIIAAGWSYIPHFYLNFYVYQYSTSVTAASALAERIGSGDTRTRDAYLAMLKAGGSDYPVALLKTCGIDLTSPLPYRAILAKFSKAMDEMETYVGVR